MLGRASAFGWWVAARSIIILIHAQELANANAQQIPYFLLNASQAA
jgi:hypothetical protein